MTMEGTQVKDNLDSEAIEAWLRAEKAPEPGTVKFDELIKDSSLPEGVAMRYNTLESAGWVFVYHQQTGDRSRINRNMLRTQLLKKLPDGSYAFKLTPPKDRDGNIIKPVQGTIKCLLHKDNPDRKHYEEMGFVACPKDNIPSQHALVQHMKKKHKVEYEAIEKERLDKEKAREREFQESIYSRIAESMKPVKAEGNPLNDELYQKRVEQMAHAREAKKKKK